MNDFSTPSFADFTPDPQQLAQQLLDGLNGPQQEAVTHSGSPLLIVAGAGSGKTTVLTRRIAYLLGVRHVMPSQILAITFTNKAAEEMRERIAQRLGPASSRMWILTFHAACVRILRENAEAIAGLSSNFTIYDTSDSKSLINMIMKDLNLKDSGLKDRGVLSVISNYKNDLRGPDAAAADANDPQSKAIATIFAEYQKRLLAANAVDFDDLIGHVVRLFRTNPAVVENYRRRFRHVLIDEYQDTNHAQYQLVHLLVGSPEEHAAGAFPGPELCVVGDADQSIYAFRGATIRNIVHFNEDYPTARTIVLDQNYRSTQNILSAANAVISHNERTQDKKLWSDLGDGEVIEGYEAANERDEAYHVVQQIEKLHDYGYKYSDMAIMYRMNFSSRTVEETLMSAGIPYVVVGGIRFFEREEVRDMIAYLRVIENPADDVSLRRIIPKPRRGIGETTINTIAAHANTMGVSLWEGMQDATHGHIASLAPRARSLVGAFVHTMEDLQAAAKSLTIDELLQRVMDETGYLAQLKKSNDPQDQSRVDNLEEFLEVAREFQEPSLAEFLEKVSLRSDADQVPSNEQEGADPQDVVALMTLHTAKGLEYPVVFLIAWEDGMFPHSRSFTEPSGLEEERRLAYVGITRAKRRLFISFANQRHMFNSYQNYPPSRFLEDIPDRLIHWEGGAPSRRDFFESTNTGYGSSASRNSYGGTTTSSTTSSTPRSTRGSASSAASSSSKDLKNLMPGDLVNHAKYGLGTVKEVTNSKPAPTIMVDFGSHGTVRIMLLGNVPMDKL
ncbi:MAG: UvrD-helicase domain-containing protein [Corynebacterium sp.]|nr:UvrD-helicase domain-containing protein [Corynebacterium sp.]